MDDNYTNVHRAFLQACGRFGLVYMKQALDIFAAVKAKRKLNSFSLHFTNIHFMSKWKKKNKSLVFGTLLFLLLLFRWQWSRSGWRCRSPYVSQRDQCKIHWTWSGPAAKFRAFRLGWSDGWIFGTLQYICSDRVSRYAFFSVGNFAL